jgi:hypothetical protein
MDQLTIKICHENLDIDEAAQKLVRLLASCKGQRMHGKAGVLAELKDGKIAFLIESKDASTRLAI